MGVPLFALQSFGVKRFAGGALSAPLLIYSQENGAQGPSKTISMPFDDRNYGIRFAIWARVLVAVERLSRPWMMPVLLYHHVKNKDSYTNSLKSIICYGNAS